MMHQILLLLMSVILISSYEARAQTPPVPGAGAPGAGAPAARVPGAGGGPTNQTAPTQADQIRAQQEQIRQRAKEIEDRALADKSIKERDDRKKAEEMREKQWIEEYPNVPFPRSTPQYPLQQRQAAPYAPQIPIQNQSSGELSNQMIIIQQLNDISQRLSRIEAIINNRANNNENQQRYNVTNYNSKDTRLINQQNIDQKNLENRISIENNYYINVSGEPKLK